jgi:transposase IS66 family protein
VGSPHVVTVRTPDERLVWYAATPSRSSEAIKGLGVMDGYHGILVRDDYAGWAQFDAQLAGVQQCGQHLARHLKGVHALHPDWQRWAEEVRQVLGGAHRAVAEAAAAGRTQLDPELLASMRQRYDREVHWGEITNRLRDWDDGRTTPATRSPAASEPKPNRSGCSPATSPCPGLTTPASRQSRARNAIRRSPGTGIPLATLARYCRVRSYLVSSRNHGIQPIDAIHAALTGHPWLPEPVNA